MLGLLAENGPCYVNPDSNSTTLNPWSWNNEGTQNWLHGLRPVALTERGAVNMLYLDQPTQVGLSYDTLTNITTNLVSGDLEIFNSTEPIPEQNATYLIGTYGSQDSNRTALGSVNAAIAAWHFLQVCHRMDMVLVFETALTLI